MFNFDANQFKDLLYNTVKMVLVEHEKPDKLTFGEDELMTVKETTTFLKVGKSKLSELTQKGIIPAYRIGSQLRYKKSEVLNSLPKVKAYGSGDYD